MKTFDMWAAIWSFIEANWQPAVIAAVFSTAIGTYFKAHVEKSIQSRLDVRLEKLRSELRRDEELLRADLRENEAQVNALRSGALSGMAGRHAMLSKRRVEAVEKIWAAAVKMKQFRLAAEFMLRIDFEATKKEKDKLEREKLKEFAGTLWKSSGLDNLKPSDAPAESERPFVTPMVWALFSTFSQVITYPAIQLAALKEGVPDLLLPPSNLLALVKTVLPHHAALLDQAGEQMLPLFLDELEEKLLAEIAKSLNGTEHDARSIEEAAEITKAAESMAGQLREQSARIQTASL